MFFFYFWGGWGGGGDVAHNLVAGFRKLDSSLQFSIKLLFR